MAYAEVIGDPIAQSKSPIIHRYWLAKLGLSGDYCRTLVTAAELKHFLERRQSDREWRGCNVTIPHKPAAAGLVDRVDPAARSIGAVNCLVPEGGSLAGYNTDIDGVSAALDGAELSGRTAVVIGAGGGARAALAYLEGRGIGQLTLLVRNPDRARRIAELVSTRRLVILPFERAELAFQDWTVAINASPLGMVGAPSMPSAILAAVAKSAAGATLFDMVTTPSRTDFSRVGEAAGARSIDGMTMLIGQAARAFELFFGVAAPPPDRKLRDLLTTGGGDLV